MLEKIETLPEKVPKEGIGSSFSPGKRKKKRRNLKPSSLRQNKNVL